MQNMQVFFFRLAIRFTGKKDQLKPLHVARISENMIGGVQTLASFSSMRDLQILRPATFMVTPIR